MADLSHLWLRYEQAALETGTPLPVLEEHRGSFMHSLPTLSPEEDLHSYVRAPNESHLPLSSLSDL